MLLELPRAPKSVPEPTENDPPPHNTPSEIRSTEFNKLSGCAVIAALFEITTVFIPVQRQMGSHDAATGHRQDSRHPL